MYEIWTVTHDRLTPYINWKIFQFWIRQYVFHLSNIKYIPFETN